MGQNKAAAARVAREWWSSRCAAEARKQGHGTCDRCDGEVPVGGGFLCNPRLPTDLTPDLVCERCFDATKKYEPWNVAARAACGVMPWVAAPECPGCHALYDLADLHPPPTAVHLACAACGTHVPLRVEPPAELPSGPSPSGRRPLPPAWQVWKRFTTEFAVQTELHRLGAAEAPTRAAAAARLGKLGPAAVDALPDLIWVLLDDDRGVREAATKALAAVHTDWAVSPVAAAVLPVLARNLAPNTPVGVKAEVVAVVKRMGPHALPALPALVRLAVANRPVPEMTVLSGAAIAAAAAAVDPDWRQGTAAAGVACEVARELYDCVREVAQARLDDTAEEHPFQGRKTAGTTTRLRATVQRLNNTLRNIGPPAAFAAPLVVAAVVEYGPLLSDSSDHVLDAIWPGWKCEFGFRILPECPNAKCPRRGKRIRSLFVFAGQEEFTCDGCGRAIDGANR